MRFRSIRFRRWTIASGSRSIARSTVSRSLNKYAIDPAKPIRISVQNGNVTLFGVVDSQGDKNAAGIRANGVPGVFSVKNDLQVAGQPTGSDGAKDAMQAPRPSPGLRPDH